MDPLRECVCVRAQGLDRYTYVEYRWNKRISAEQTPDTMPAAAILV
eukprot:COSAG01_NODE_1672_length_9554_cov_4.065785_11_plen_46_part_00